MTYLKKPKHVHKKIYIEGETDQKISAFLERPELNAAENTVVLMIHSFPGNKHGQSNLFDRMEKIVSSKSYDTFRFDFRGCGDSAGNPENFTLKNAGVDLRRMMNWCRQEGYERFIFVTEGLGTAIAMMNMAPDVRALISVSGVFNVPKFARARFSKALSNPDNPDYFLLKEQKIGKAFLQELGTTNLVPYLETIRCPCLILHGAKDPYAQIDQLDLIRNHMVTRRIEITTFEDGGHDLHSDNHRKYIFYHAMQFIEKYA